MICPQCGFENTAPARFCASCQTFLDWEEDPPSTTTRTGRTPPRTGSTRTDAPRTDAPRTDSTRTGSARTGPTRTGPTGTGSTGTGPGSTGAGSTGAPAAGGGQAAAAGGGSTTTAPDTAPATPTAPTAPTAGTVPDTATVRTGRTTPRTPSAPPDAPPRPRTPPPTPPRDGDRDSAEDHGPAAEPGTAPDAEPGAGRLRRPGDEQEGTGRGPDHREPAPDEEAPPAPEPGPTRPCPRCRTANPAERRLCLRCGSPLAPDPAPAPTVARTPWWRGLPRGRRERTLEAGSRPRQRARVRLRPALPVAVLLLAALAWFARSQLGGLFTFAQDETGRPEALVPEQVRASSQAEGHAANAAFDGLNNRYWAPDAPGRATGQYLQARFAKPVRLSKLILTSGASVNKDEFLALARPAALTVTLYTADGGHTTEDLGVRDQPGEQTFTLRGRDVVRIRFTVRDSYGNGPGRRVALAEVELFGSR